MATLSLSNTFIAGTLAKASEVNQNFIDLVNWSSGNIQNDNLGIMSGPITWAITTGVKAIVVANSGNEGSISITQSAGLNPLESTLRIIDNAAQTSGDAEVYVSMTSISSTIPILKLDYAGSQVLAVKKDRVELPVRTKAQRNAITSPSDGSILYVKDSPDSKDHGVHIREANGWSNIMPSGVMMPYAGTTVPDGWFECNGQAVSKTTYAALFAAIGTTWGDAGADFNLPDMRRRTAIGRGGTSVAGPGTSLGNTGGHEQLTAHTHAGGTTGSSSADHQHYMFTPGDSTGQGLGVAPNNGVNDREVSITHTYELTANTTGGTVNRGLTASSSTAGGTAHTHSVPTTGSTGSGNAQNMQPSAVVTYIIKS